MAYCSCQRQRCCKAFGRAHPNGWCLSADCCTARKTPAGLSSYLAVIQMTEPQGHVGASAVVETHGGIGESPRCNARQTSVLCRSSRIASSGHSGATPAGQELSFETALLDDYSFE